ncbi:hypothetical protein HF1_06120 [Mycoplasma haemofelis str. Langford 1]|uniref:Uncharacterized protein n=1 Tax=Mycoplasma haemofelis (strain Langford 1) TaxID=941640 RepID=E8ZHJ9_MYCHL|nr:hypothetical protein [Mycoplasma haemofelis]CBY92620.1 hypothetical protein HF1_06120 [Mycoplasma haemofelis str. Langford 1]
MSKLSFMAAGAAGVGAAGAGGFLLLKDQSIPSTTFKERYEHAWLPKTSNLWSSRLASLKKGVPVHIKLIEAAKKDGDEANRLLQEGCSLIYEEPFENSKYQKDFELYCSKTNKDVGSKAWNGDEKNNTSWDAPLTSLKSHDPSTGGTLPNKLLEIQKEIKSTGAAPHDEAIREKLKNWCEEIQSRVYEGSESSEFKQQELYCRK